MFPSSRTQGAKRRSAFSISGCKKYLTDYIERGEKAPLVLSDTHGMSWIASFECANSYVCRVYMLGPAFNSAVSSLQIRSELQKQGYTAELTEQFCTRIDALPVIPVTLWLNYGTMMNLTVTGMKPEISDFQYQIHDSGKPEEFTRQMPTNNTWIAEQEAMRAIEEGNPDYQDASANLSTHDIYSSSFSSEQQMKKLRTAMYSFIALCTRAAIRGGLVPETAYYIGEVYMDQVETCRNPTELAQLDTAMFDDFVHRVHTVRSQSLSPEIQNCCAYIQKHIRENIDMKALAHATGYVEYYLTKNLRKK